MGGITLVHVRVRCVVVIVVVVVCPENAYSVAVDTRVTGCLGIEGKRFSPTRGTKRSWKKTRKRRRKRVSNAAGFGTSAPLYYY